MKALVKEVYKAVQTGLNATNAILPKIQDPSLRQKVEKQGVCYRNIASQAETIMQENGLFKEELGAMQKVGMWAGLQMHTLTDCSTSHLAELMINGTNMGIIDVTKQLNACQSQNPVGIDLAKEYLHGEEKHIEALKTYL